MSDKAETVTCDECFGRYKPETCPKCSGTGVRTTGEVDKSEDNPPPETDVSAMNVPVAVDNIEDKLRLARAEVERLATVYADHSATIAEQAAEIERLIHVYSDQTDTIVKQAEKLTALDRERAALEAERDEYQDAARRLAGVVDVNNGKINEANARAEKYLAVIKAKDAELVAVHRCWVAAIKSAEAMTAAGMVIDAFVQSEQEDADHD